MYKAEQRKGQGMGNFRHTLQTHVGSAPPQAELQDYPPNKDRVHPFCTLNIGIEPKDWPASAGVTLFISRTPACLDDWADELHDLALQCRLKADQLKADEDAEQALRSDIESNDQVHW